MLLLYLLPLLSPLQQHCLGFQRRLHEGVLICLKYICSNLVLRLFVSLLLNGCFRLQPP
jgi:hypothetical protein